MGRGEYHKTTAYKKSAKRGKDSTSDLLGLLALPLLPVAIPLKIASKNFRYADSSLGEGARA